MELPLFPLNTVLFPGMPLNLHIFEERYKLMINDCINSRREFGVVLIADNKRDIAQNIKPHLVGCTAKINQVQPLKDGRMNITAVGQERFKLLSFHNDKPYLSGTIETYPLIVDNSALILQNTLRLRDYLKEYIKNLQNAGQLQVAHTKLPNDPKALMYLAAVLLQVEPIKKQKLLEIERMIDLTRTLLSTYRTELSLIELMLNQPEDIDFKGIFSLN